ncbi:unnamed protein product [Closterium sp. NIES-65]|nr:unnamed protein product [Closterium sp. NIES-65]
MAGIILVAMGLFIAIVSMLDVIVAALCATDQCPEALMLSAGSATIGGIANMIVAPIFGNLSDKHGRKPFLLLSIACITIPNAILATSSSRLALSLLPTTLSPSLHLSPLSFPPLLELPLLCAPPATPALLSSLLTLLPCSSPFCPHFLFLFPLSASLPPARPPSLFLSIHCTLSIQADVTEETDRAAAFGAISGTTSVGFLAGPLVARFVPPAITFHVATLLCSCGWAYILIMVPESLPASLPESPSESLLSQPLLRKAASLADVERGHSLAAADAAVAAVDGVWFPRGVSEGGGGVRSGRRGVSRESTLAAIAAAVAADDGEGNSEGGQEGGGGVRSGIGSGGGSGGGSRVSILAAAAAAVAAVDGVGIAGEGQEGGGGVSRGGRGGGGGSGGGVGERTSLLEGCGDGGNGEKGGGRQVGGGGSAGAGRGGARSVKRSKSAVLMRSRSTLKEAAMHIRFSRCPRCPLTASHCLSLLEWHCFGKYPYFCRLVSMLLLVAFLHAFADNGQVANMLYVFKAKFHWGKNDFSLYTAGIGLFAVLSHLLLLPLLLKMLPLPSLLILAISINTVHVVLYGLAWKPWVSSAAYPTPMQSTPHPPTTSSHATPHTCLLH